MCVSPSVKTLFWCLSLDLRTAELKLQQQHGRRQLRIAREQILLGSLIDLLIELRLFALRGGIGISQHIQILPGIDGSPHLLRRHLDRHIRIDAPFLGILFTVNALAIGQVIVAGRQLQVSRSIGETEELLNTALAEGALADDQRAVMILQRAGDDFAGLAEY